MRPKIDRAFAVLSSLTFLTYIVGDLFTSYIGYSLGLPEERFLPKILLQYGFNALVLGKILTFLFVIFLAYYIFNYPHKNARKVAYLLLFCGIIFGTVVTVLNAISYIEHLKKRGWKCKGLIIV